MRSCVPDILPGDGGFSVAERSALVLDHELYPLMLGLMLPDAIDGVALRAQAVATARATRLVAELDTAAWIWGARAAPPPRPEFASPLGLAPRLSATAAAQIREVRFDPDELTEIAGQKITTRRRTALDLVRYRTDTDYRPETVRALIDPSEISLLVMSLSRTRRLPHARRARARLSLLMTRRDGP